jgi:hypothetical protein
MLQSTPVSRISFNSASVGLTPPLPYQNTISIKSFHHQSTNKKKAGKKDGKRMNE